MLYLNSIVLVYFCSYLQFGDMLVSGRQDAEGIKLVASSTIQGPLVFILIFHHLCTSACRSI